MAELVVHIHLETVIGAHSLREPMRCVRHRGVSQRRRPGERRSQTGVIEICPGRIVRRARRRRANDDISRNVGVDRENFMVPVRPDVADTQGRVRQNLPLDFEVVGNHSGRLEIGLYAAWNDERRGKRAYALNLRNRGLFGRFH